MKDGDKNICQQQFGDIAGSVIFGSLSDELKFCLYL